MSERLPANLDNALRSISNQEFITIYQDDIRQLLAFGYIRHALRGGWLINSMGWDYLKRHMKLSENF